MDSMDSSMVARWQPTPDPLSDWMARRHHVTKNCRLKCYIYRSLQRIPDTIVRWRRARASRSLALALYLGYLGYLGSSPTPSHPWTRFYMAH
jgi:hypothetical protein